MVKFEAVEIDAHAMQLRIHGELVTTTATEFRLLDYLARHPGRVFSRDQVAGRSVGRRTFCDAALCGRVCAPDSREN